MPTLDELRERFKQHRPRALRRDNIQSVPSGNVPSTEWASVEPLPAWADSSDAEILGTMRIKVRITESVIESMFTLPVTVDELRAFILGRLLEVPGVNSLAVEEIKPIAREREIISGDFIFIVEVPRRLHAALSNRFHTPGIEEVES